MTKYPCISKDAMWQAVISCDRSYDGVFFYAVKTTGRYCRPSCKSKTPLEKNVHYFFHVNDAEKMGYTPCKRCQPQQQGMTYDPYEYMIKETVAMMEKYYDQKIILDDIASKVGVSRYHLNRICKWKTGNTPRVLLEQIRIRKAKALLLTTNLSNTEIGYQVGYESLSSFYKAFQRHLGVSPKEYRRMNTCETFKGDEDLSRSC